MIFKDYYKILNIDGPKHTMDEIKIAYRDQAKKYHPDVNVWIVNHFLYNFYKDTFLYSIGVK